MESGKNILRIGDYVTFKNLKYNSLLCAEGILLEDVIVDENVKVLDDCLFCIHLQRQYSASKELEEFIASRDSANVDDANSAKYYHALQVLLLVIYKFTFDFQYYQVYTSS